MMSGDSVASRDKNEVAYVCNEILVARPAPLTELGVIGWVRKNLFSSLSNVVLTLVCFYIVYKIAHVLFDFAILDAVWAGVDGKACRLPNNTDGGACWPFIGAYFDQYVYGSYPYAERWRVNIVYLVGALGIAWLIFERSPARGLVAILMLILFPVFSFILLTGGNFNYSPSFIRSCIFLVFIILGFAFAVPIIAKSSPAPSVIFAASFLGITAVILLLCSIDFGLPVVETNLWGGLLVTLVIAVTGIVFSLPFGVILALGRQSGMPAVRLVSVIFIEFWRGVPLVTVLFMASVMLPLFMSKGIHIDKLLRAMIGVAFFSSAYMAETVRGGLQAIPKGQYEAAKALGLNYWKMTGLIALPQALKLVIPAIVSAFIALFKDTTLVSIVGLLDLLGQAQSSLSDPKWTSPYTGYTAYLFLGLIFWIFCFAMSRYSIYLERKLDVDHGQ